MTGPEALRLLRSVVEARPEAACELDDGFAPSSCQDPGLLYAFGWAHAASPSGDPGRAVLLLEQALRHTTSLALRDACVWSLAEAGRLDLAVGYLRDFAAQASEDWERKLYEEMLRNPRFSARQG